MANISDNIGSLIKAIGISARALEQSIGCSNGVISRCINKGTDISSQWVSKIIDTYPEINPTWLLTGKGEMLKPSNSPTTTNERRAEKSHQHQHTELEIETRPRIPMEAAAGSLSVLTQSVDQSQCDQVPVIASIPDYDFTIMVKGDSMVPEFKSGDEIACRLIRESAFIQWGQPYVVDSYNGIVLKRIHDNGDSIKCTSDNPQYGAFYIPKSEIYRLALVVGLVRLY